MRFISSFSEYICESLRLKKSSPLLVVVWASGLVVPLGCGASFVVPFILGFRVSLVVPSFIVGWTSVVFFGLSVGVFASIGLLVVAPPSRLLAKIMTRLCQSLPRLFG